MYIPSLTTSAFPCLRKRPVCPRRYPLRPRRWLFAPNACIPRQSCPISELSSCLPCALSVVDHVSPRLRILAHFCASCTRTSYPARLYEYQSITRKCRDLTLSFYASLDFRLRRLHFTRDLFLANIRGVAMRTRDVVLATWDFSCTFSLPCQASHIYSIVPCCA